MGCVELIRPWISKWLTTRHLDFKKMDITKKVTLISSEDGDVRVIITYLNERYELMACSSDEETSQKLISGIEAHQAH
jgi:hypothetical protein